jgi:hypothetical protein
MKKAKKNAVLTHGAGVLEKAALSATVILALIETIRFIIDLNNK